MQKKHFFDYFFCVMKQIKDSVDCKYLTLSFPQIMVLKIIQSHGKIQNSQIAKELNITKASMSSMITKLEQQGYLSKQKNKTDKRVCLISLSKQGLEILHQTRQNIITGSEKIFKNLTNQEKTQLENILKKIC